MVYLAGEPPEVMFLPLDYLHLCRESGAGLGRRDLGVQEA